MELALQMMIMAEVVLTRISFAFGLVVATAVWGFGHISGHVNPAVTAAMLVTRKITLVKAVLYVGCQMAGAVAGAAAVKGEPL